MAVSVLHTTNVIAGASGTSKSYNHTCNASTTLLLVRVALRGTSATPSSVSVTYGGTSMNAVPGTAISHSTGYYHAAAFYLAYPTKGSSLSVAASWTGTANCVIVATDVSGGASVSSGAGVNATSNNPNVTTGTSGNGLIFDTVVTKASRTVTVAGGGTAQYAELDTSVGSNDLSTRGATATLGASVKMEYTLDSSDAWVMHAFVVPEVTTGNAGNFFAVF